MKRTILIITGDVNFGQEESVAYENDVKVCFIRLKKYYQLGHPVVWWRILLCDNWQARRSRDVLRVIDIGT